MARGSLSHHKAQESNNEFAVQQRDRADERREAIDDAVRSSSRTFDGQLR